MVPFSRTILANTGSFHDEEFSMLESQNRIKFILGQFLFYVVPLFHFKVDQVLSKSIDKSVRVRCYTERKIDTECKEMQEKYRMQADARVKD